MESNKDVLIEGKGIGSEYTNMMVNDRWDEIVLPDDAAPERSLC